MALDIEMQELDGTIVLAVSGEVDLYSSPDLRSAVLKQLGRASKAVAVDLSAVPYMDSSGVATLVEGLRNAKTKNVNFMLIAPSESVMKVLQLSRLDSVFEIRPQAG
jgi:anti-sigma B factor antagonist